MALMQYCCASCMHPSIPGTLIWHVPPVDQLVIWAIVSPGGWPEPWGLGQRLGCFARWGGEGGMGERGSVGGYRDGCRPRLGRAQCQGLSGTPFFLGACSAPSWGPQRGAGIHGQCKTGPSALLPLSCSCQHPPITCSIGTLWKWPTAAWPSWHAWLTFNIFHHGFCVLCATVWVAAESLLFLLQRVLKSLARVASLRVRHSCWSGKFRSHARMTENVPLRRSAESRWTLKELFQRAGPSCDPLLACCTVQRSACDSYFSVRQQAWETPWSCT